MYFNRLPNIYYPLNIGGEEQFVQVKDITMNIRFIKEFVSNITLYEYYDMHDDDTPELVSERFYGTPYYHWILMILNEKYDYLNDFPLGYVNLEQYVKDKYGEDNIYDTHHYENSEGYVVDSSYPGATSVSNFDYETKLNEEKRRIKIVDRSILEKIVSDFVKAFVK